MPKDEDDLPAKIDKSTLNKDGIVFKKRAAKRNGRNRMNQKDLQSMVYAPALRKLGVHKPARATSARDVKIITDLKNMLSTTWSQVFREVDNYKRFSPKQLEFFRRYAINGRRSIAKSAKQAGYESTSAAVLHDIGRQNLRLPHAEELVRAFEFEERARMGLRVEEVAAWFEKIANAAMETGDFANANRAMENYGKYLGMFVERKEITHTTIHSKEELDARIAELQKVLSEERETIATKLTIN